MSRVDRRNDHGNLIIVMSIMMVLGALAVAVLARTMSSQTSARQATEFAGALGPADAGVSDALFRLDQLASGAAPPATFCVGSSSSCLAPSLPGAPDTEYVATYDATTRILTVRSKGVVNGRPHGVEAEVSRSRAFRFAIFGNDEVLFNGNSQANIETVDENGNPTEEFDAEVGTNDEIVCNGASGGGGESNVGYPGSDVDEDCNNPVELDSGIYEPLAPVAVADCEDVDPNVPATPCYPGTAENCPADPSTGYLPNPLPPGKYLCRSTVKFLPGYHEIGSDATNGGVVELFVIPLAGTANVELDDSYINVGAGANPATEADDVDGDPTKLRVYLAGSGAVQTAGGSSAKRFVGIVYAPESHMTANGCKEQWRGALVLGDMTCNGGPNLSIEYDVRVARLEDEDWTISNYREIPSADVVLPA